MIPPTPDKYLKVTLREVDGKYFISAIQSTTAPEHVTQENVTEKPAPKPELPDDIPAIEEPSETETEPESESETTQQ
jgi:hypothetical protein